MRRLVGRDSILVRQGPGDVVEPVQQALALKRVDGEWNLAPGWVDTPGNRATGRLDDALASVPLGRAASPEEMADLVWFLAGEGRAGYVTGETITATGGSAFR